ncbi:MAG: hypothetical protein ACR2P2_15080 [Nakamurella sp.]
MVFRDAPDPCTEDVFWWRRGQFYRIDFDDSTIRPVLAPELSQVVAALPG